MLERSTTATALADVDGRLIYVNPAFLRLWGFGTLAELLGHDLAAGFWAEPDAARAAVDSLRSQSVWHGELTAVTTLGTWVPLRITLQLLRDDQHRPTSMLGNFLDIGGEVAARVALEAEREFSELVLGSAGVLILALDEEGRFIRFNPECERVSGWRCEEVLGRWPWETVLPPEVGEAVRTQAFLAAMEAADIRKATHFTNEWLTRSGARRRIEWTNRVAVDWSQRRRIMVSVGVDVTARDEAERALARSEAQLRAAQAVARLGSWTLDIPSGRLDWSDEVFQLFEIDRSERVATYQNFLQSVHPDDRDLVEQTYARSLQTREPYVIEHRLRTPDGRIKWVEERCETEFDADGMPLRSRGTVQDVTDRHLRDVELQRFRLMVEHAPEEVWLSDETLRIVYANAVAGASLGYTPEQLVGMSLADIDAGGDASVRKVVLAVDDHRRTEGQPKVFRIQHRAADGRLVPKEVYATVRDIDGRPLGISFARDISEQVRAQQAMAASEALLRTTLDTYPGWVSCVDADMRYVYVNAQFATLVGRPVDEIIGSTPDEVLGEVGQEDRLTTHRRLLGDDPSLSAERRIVDRDDRERIVWVEYRRAAAVAPDSRPLLYAFATDLTEFRRVQRRLTAVTQDIGVGVWEWSIRSGDFDFNDELLALAGYSRDDVDGHPMDWLDARVEPTDLQRRQRLIEDLIAGRLARAQMQMRVRHKHGQTVWVQEVLRVVGSDETGHALRLIGVAQDISALKAREAQLESIAEELEARVLERTQALAQAKQDAERANAAKSEFLSQMSHELRTPLNAIIGFAQLLEMSTLPAEEGEYAQEVMQAGQHLLQLIDEILDLATVESGRLQLRPVPVALQPLVEECTRLMAPVAQTAGVTLRIGELPGQATVSADAGRLKQVLLNLLSNAVKYNRADGQVQVSVGPCATGWELWVADTGAGLTEEQIGRLFQPFERLGAERSAVQGTGIGLTLSRRLAEQMGGALNVSSRPGEGSTFRLCLPAVDPGLEAPAPDSRHHGARIAMDTLARGRRYRLLYVEDNVPNQRLVARLLARRSDIDLLIVSTASEALALAPAWQPALLLIDIQLPDGDGYTLLRDLRSCGVQAIAVAVSANAMPADRARGRAAGFAEYLTKPLALAQVLTSIDTHLGIRAAPDGPDSS